MGTWRSTRDLVEGFGWTPAGFAADYSVAIRVTPTRVRIL